MSGPVKCIHYRLPFLSFRPYRMRPISGICVCIVSEVSVHLTSVSSASPQSRTFLVFSSLSAYLRVLSGLLWPTLDSGDSNLPEEPGNAACVAGRRKEGKSKNKRGMEKGRPLPRSSRVRPSRASRARLSPFPHLRTAATQASLLWELPTLLGPVHMEVRDPR